MKKIQYMVDIGGAARVSGLTRRALRFYEAAGLIGPKRDRLGYRRYDDETLERLQIIGTARRAGVPVREIGELLRLMDTAGVPAARARLIAACEKRLADIEGQQRLILEIMSEMASRPVEICAAE